MSNTVPTLPQQGGLDSPTDLELKRETSADLSRSIVPPEARQTTGEEEDSQDAESLDSRQIPWQYKWTAFSMIILFAFGRYVHHCRKGVSGMDWTGQD